MGKVLYEQERIHFTAISNEEMCDIIKMIETLEKANLLIDGALETVKHEIKKQEGRFLGAIMEPMAALLIEPMNSLFK